MSVGACPKCGSRNTYEGYLCFCCRMCGNVWDDGLVKPTYLSFEDSEDGKTSDRKVECLNCHRVKFIQGYGLCWKCHGAVRGLTPHTPEYDAALAAVLVEIAKNVKRRFRNVGYHHRKK